MSNFKCSHCGMDNIEKSDGHYYTISELLDKIEDLRTINKGVCTSTHRILNENKQLLQENSLMAKFVVEVLRALELDTNISAFTTEDYLSNLLDEVLTKISNS